MSASLATRLIRLYGTRFPDHPGKWRVVVFLRHLLKPRPEAEEVVVKSGGLQWLVDPRSYPQSELYWLGSWDQEELQVLRRLLRPGAVVVDIGANIGVYALSLAADRRLGCRTIAFEPNPPLFDRLRGNIALNHLERDVQALPLALGDQPGKAYLSVALPGNDGSASIGPSGVEVEVATLDCTARAMGLDRIDFIKMDVEGFEERVLRGGLATLRRFRPGLLLELNPEALARHGSTPERVISLLRELDYQAHGIGRRGRLVPLGDLERIAIYVNIIALPATPVDPEWLEPGLLNQEHANFKI